MCGLGCSAACGILVPQPGIKPIVPWIGRQSLNQWTTKEVLNRLISKFLSSISLAVFFYLIYCNVDSYYSIFYIIHGILQLRNLFGSFFDLYLFVKFLILVVYCFSDFTDSSFCACSSTSFCKSAKIFT